MQSSTRTTTTTSIRTTSTITPLLPNNEINNMWLRANGDWDYDKRCKSSSSSSLPVKKIATSSSITSSCSINKPIKKKKISKREAHERIEKAVIAEERKAYIHGLATKDLLVRGVEEEVVLDFFGKETSGDGKDKVGGGGGGGKSGVGGSQGKQKRFTKAPWDYDSDE